MYSTKDEQEPVMKQLQKASKIPKFVDIGSGTEDEQGPTVKQPRKAPKIPGRPGDEGPQEKSPGEQTKKLPATGRTPATSCTHILTSGVRKGKQ